MSEYPMARWLPTDTSVGASLWTRELKEGEGGGYYLYDWKRGVSVITLRELVEGTTRAERQFPIGKRSGYVHLGDIPVPEPVRNAVARLQDIGVARIIVADMTERFGKVAEWITYDNAGKPVWFHDKIMEEGR